MNIVKKLESKYKSLSIVVKATLWFTFCSILQKSISFITTPIFTRLLTEEEYGLFSAYQSWLSILTVIVTLKLDQGVFNKGMSKYKDNRDVFTSSMQGLTLLLTTAALTLYLVFHTWINDFTELSTIITLAMFAELYFIPSYHFWMRRQRYDFKYINVVVVTIAFSIINVLMGLATVLSTRGDKGVARILSVVLVQVVFGFVLFIINWKKGKHLFNKEFWKFGICFNLPLIPHYISLYILQQSDRIMIQKFCDLASVAKYSVVYNLGMIISIVSDSLNQSIIPWLYRELEDKRFENIKKKTNMILILVVAMLLFFMLFAPEVMEILAPVSYQDAIYILPPITASIFFIYLYTFLGNVEFFYDYNKVTMIVSSVGAVLNVFLNWLLIPIFGYVAAAYTTLFCYVLFALSHYLFVAWIAKKKEQTAIFDSKFIAFLSVTLIVACLLLSLIYDYYIIRYSLIVISTIICVIKRKQLLKFFKSVTEKKKIA